ncbi:MAG TPA: hypothetical protein VM287_07590 [Egibacteraceae bacterium]|nr:hypothetical protein [Egibacteraceae bacterium]
MRATRFIAVLAAVALFMSGCGNGNGEDEASPTPAETPTETPTDTPDEQGAAPATLAVTATDDAAGGGYAFELPESVEAGATQIELTNTGAEPHHAQLFQLNPDATMDDLGATLAAGDPSALMDVGAFAGGTGVVSPGGTSSAEAVADLTEGTYAFLCFVENAEGVPHLAQGMVQPLEVTAAEDPAPMPDADADVTLVDYSFELPELGGDEVLSISNGSEAEPHELNILRLEPGATMDDVLAIAEAEGEEPPGGPPPFAGVGGLNGLVPGGSSALALDLEPGDYVFACFIPSFDPRNEGQSHAELGMIEQVTIE